jgi:hypothetical protein
VNVSLFIWKGVPLFITPFVLGTAWWMWLGSERERSRRRGVALLIGLAAVTANAVMFYAWVAYRAIAGPSPDDWRTFNFLGNNIATCLVFAGLAGAVVGKGRGRLLTAVAAVTGLLLWVPIAIL